jgi:hypothetical protein
MRGARLPALVALAALAASCAPHRLELPRVETGERRALYLTALAARERAGAAVDAELTVWTRVEGAGALPGATGSVALAAPRAFRIRIASLFGTALDLAARADSLTAVLPGRRTAVAADAAADSFGVADPGGLGVRLLSAAWRPPDDAWAGAVAVESLLVVRWAERRDSLALAIDGSGLPRSVTLTRRDGGEWRARYDSWSRESGAAWPAVIECADRDQRMEVTIKLDRVRFRARPDPARLAVRIPGGVRIEPWKRFRENFESWEDWLR